MLKLITLDGIKLEEDTPQQLTLKTVRTAFAPIALLALTVLFGVLILYITLVGLSDITATVVAGLIFAVIFLLLAFFTATSIKISFDQNSRKLILARSYILGFGSLPRTRTQEWDFLDIKSLHRQTLLGAAYLMLDTRYNQRLQLVFRSNKQVADHIAQILVAWFNLPAESTQPVDISGVSAVPQDALAFMHREIRQWGYWSIGLGVLHLILSGTFNPWWGLTLIAVGASSFVFRDAAMFVVYAVTMGWVAISNLISSGLGTWTVLALFQLFWAYRLFRQFFAFKKAQVALNQAEPAEPSRAAQVFPWAGLFFGSFALLGFFVAFVGIFALAFAGVDDTTFFGSIENIALNLGILAIATTLASLLADFKPKVIAGIGMAGGAMVVLAELAFGIFF
jgi:hypothetical protein